MLQQADRGKARQVAVFAFQTRSHGDLDVLVASVSTRQDLEDAFLDVGDSIEVITRVVSIGLTKRLAERGYEGSLAWSDLF